MQLTNPPRPQFAIMICNRIVNKAPFLHLLPPLLLLFVSDIILIFMLFRPHVLCIWIFGEILIDIGTLCNNCNAVILKYEVA